MTSHTTHHTEDVVVNSVDTELSADDGTVDGAADEWFEISDEAARHAIGIERAVFDQGVGVANNELEVSSVDTREVSAARWLVFFGLEGERVNIDTGRTRDVGVGLVGLNQVEIATNTSSKTILTVELELSFLDWVSREERASVVIGEGTENISVIGPLVVGEDSKIVNIGLADEALVLNNPDEFLHWVIEVQTSLVARSGDIFAASELELFDQVFVRNLGEAAAFISIEVNIVNPEGSAFEAEVGEARISSDHELGSATEIDVDLDFVVLEGNQRERETNIAIEPELQWHEEDLSGLVLSRPLLEGSWELGITANRSTDHILVSEVLTSGDGEFTPDLEPVTIVLVDLLSTDFDNDVLDQMVTNIVNPAERRTLASNAWKLDLEVDTVDQISITGDGGASTLAEVSLTIEALFDGFDGEVGVAAVNYLEESDLRGTSEVNILGTIGN